MLPIQWRWAVAWLGRSHVRVALWRILRIQQRFHMAKGLPDAIRNPEPLASALRLESARRASAVDRLAHESSQVRRVRRRYSVRYPTLPASARSHLSYHLDRAARCLLAATDLPATARMQETELPAVAKMQESGPLLPPRTP